ncbi:MAG: nucleoside triphosphate pyrophosphatase [Pedobacter sp.]|nr:nucleoside triphosphate pyrophosphatase [Pedobacter sp.]
MSATALPLLLASSSPARRQLLGRLGLPFRHESPDIDESPRPGETVAALAGRLSEAKARALASRHPDHLIIGSDQTLSLDDEILGKPGNHAKAVAQLQRLSGRTVTFHTGLCLLNTGSGRHQLTVETYTVSFRTLTDAAIERYLQAEQPYGCAGSFMAEGLGISLFREFSGRDPNTLIGLPLMALVDMLQTEGLQIP